MGKTINKIIETLGEIIENDKTLIICTLLIYGVLAMVLDIKGSMGLVDKLSAGLLGMAIGRSLK